MATPQLIVSIKRLGEQYDYSHVDDTIVAVDNISDHIRMMQAQNKAWAKEGQVVRAVWRIDYTGELVQGEYGVCTPAELEEEMSEELV